MGRSALFPSESALHRRNVRDGCTRGVVPLPCAGIVALVLTWGEMTVRGLLSSLVMHVWSDLFCIPEIRAWQQVPL